METQQLVLANNKTPGMVATDFLSVIKDIENCIEEGKGKVSEIENRGLFKSLISSSSSDLVDISQSQNKINGMMLGLIQEVITLNTMSYSFLAAVIGEMEQRFRNGWKDSNGRYQRLSDTGRQFADKAHDIFVKILDGSKSTLDKIALNQQSIEVLRIEFDLRSEEIAGLKSALSDKSIQIHQSQEAISNIKAGLELKAARLSDLDKAFDQKKQVLEEHGKAIQALTEELRENSRTDLLREQNIEDIQSALDGLRLQIDGLGVQLEDSRLHALRGIGRLKIVAAILAVGWVALAGLGAFYIF
ncbi:hypothetical protein [Pollutimonas sp. M17]|uniref:hypothetical protein n=1 Tax=Pollutimonas sp. M17 TaxID=2962065 RepID=UPI0021F4169D|nr:hypothetical protein [Pollutimonas sp. M17]UYO92982.1 hypothetical protein OEG81_13955 [Pollutimonas sp. M17]